MSKIGRKPIDITSIQVDVKGDQIHYKGQVSSGIYTISDLFDINVSDNVLVIVPRKNSSSKSKNRDVNRQWGMHRALLFNALSGSRKEFEKNIIITGLGYKAVASGSKLVFTLGYSHKIDFAIPEGVTFTIDKTGQKVLAKSSDKQLLGQVCDEICSLRKPEPYKGTGIMLSTDTIIRKAGKTKS